MPVKDREKQREIANAWYQKNKETHKANTAKNKQRYRAEWLAFKHSLQCSHCGVSHPAVMDFHHVIRDKDKKSVNLLISNGRYSAAREEIKKCIPLCANCHRILHWDEEKAKKAMLSILSQTPSPQQGDLVPTSHTGDAQPSDLQPKSPASECGPLASPPQPKQPRTRGLKLK